MVSDSLTTSHSHKLAALSLAESSSRSSCPDRAGSYFEAWQAARAAERRAGFSLHNPLTRNPDVPGHSFLSLSTSHHPAVTLIISETPLSRETNNLFFLLSPLGRAHKKTSLNRNLPGLEKQLQATLTK